MAEVTKKVKDLITRNLPDPTHALSEHPLNGLLIDLVKELAELKAAKDDLEARVTALESA